MSLGQSAVHPEMRVACVPGAIHPDERPAHFALAARLFGELAAERRRLPDGYAFRFDPEMLLDVARFVENERRCCPFVTFVIELGPRSGPLWLRLTGPEGTDAFLAAELPGVG